MNLANALFLSAVAAGTYLLAVQFDEPAVATAIAKATPVVAKATSSAIGTSRCDCKGPQDCVCDNCKCLACKVPKVEPVAVVKPEPPPTGKQSLQVAAPLYTHPQPIAAPVAVKAAPIAAPRVQYVRQWRPFYGPLGRERGGQWVWVPVQPPRQYQRTQPVYRYRTCANGSCR